MHQILVPVDGEDASVELCLLKVMPPVFSSKPKIMASFSTVLNTFPVILTQILLSHSTPETCIFLQT